MQLNLKNFDVRRSNPYLAGPIGLSANEERYIVKAQGLTGFEIFGVNFIRKFKEVHQNNEKFRLRR